MATINNYVYHGEGYHFLKIIGVPTDIVKVKRDGVEVFSEEIGTSASMNVILREGENIVTITIKGRKKPSITKKYIVKI